MLISSIAGSLIAVFDAAILMTAGMATLLMANIYGEQSRSFFGGG